MSAATVHYSGGSKFSVQKKFRGEQISIEVWQNVLPEFIGTQLQTVAASSFDANCTFYVG